MSVSSASCFFLTKIQGDSVSRAERIGDFFLTPAMYLWNGKKVDLIKERDKIAVQTDFLYDPKEKHSSEHTTLMVVLLLPATLIGTVFKAYATCLYHGTEEDVFIKKCLAKEVGQIDKVFVQVGNTEFGERITALIAALRQTQKCSINSWFPKSDEPFFLSEVEVMSFHGDQIWQNPRDNCIKEGIHFLWNLNSIVIQNQQLTEEQVTALKQINPWIRSKLFEQSSRASDYDFTMRRVNYTENDSKIKWPCS